MDLDKLASPDLYPFEFDANTGRTRFVAMDEAAYRAASFLDGRLPAAAQPGQWADWAELKAAADRLGDNECHFIFHTGHVGSTLLSRLLGQSPRLLSLREPEVLRVLAREALSDDADEALAEKVAVFLKLWARSYRPVQRTLLKATSFTSELGPSLMVMDRAAQAILLLVTPSVYLAGILGGGASRDELQALAPMRMDRLNRRLGRAAWRVQDLGHGEMAAMSWLCETVTLATIAAEFPDRVLWLDFEAFLDNPGPNLAACLRKVSGWASPEEVDGMLASPDLTRYSKAPEFAYDAALRRRMLAQGARTHAEEIAKGVAWLNTAGAVNLPLAKAMRLAAAGMRGAAPAAG